jgi:hypothetical protein
MSAVSATLLQTIKELNDLPALAMASLGGGTNLAIRYNHRKSIDIDLFFQKTIGRTGFDQITSQLFDFYDGNVFGLTYPADLDEQFIFLRFFIKTNQDPIKVDIMQNMLMLDEPEEICGIRLVSELDIGVFKLITAANRASFKDIYDLDYLTERIPLIELYKRSDTKEKMYSQDSHQNIFDLDDKKSPVQFPELLLKFEQPTRLKNSRPDHSHNRIELVEGNKTWMQARSSWRKKVRQLFNQLDLDFPAPQFF